MSLLNNTLSGSSLGKGRKIMFKRLLIAASLVAATLSFQAPVLANDSNNSIATRYGSGVGPLKRSSGRNTVHLSARKIGHKAKRYHAQRKRIRMLSSKSLVITHRNIRIMHASTTCLTNSCVIIWKRKVFIIFALLIANVST